MKLTAHIPYEANKYNNTLTRPRGLYDMRMVADHPGEQLPASAFPLSPRDKANQGYATFEWDLAEANSGDQPISVAGLSALCTYPSAITKENAHLIWPLIKKTYPVNRVPSTYAMPVIHRLMALNGWDNLHDLFTIIPDQFGWGYMGGTGCGRLIHKLMFSKVTGVKDSVAAAVRNSPKEWVKWHMATLLFHSMLGEVKQLRRDTKHLRENIQEDEVFVTLDAHPICQKTVHYTGAHGYPVRSMKEGGCSCVKCAKALNIPVNMKSRRLAGAVPVMQVGEKAA